MKSIIYFCSVLIFIPGFLSGQGTDYAGPDKSACQGAGVNIGNASPGNVCYTWQQADGLNPADIHSSSPIVKPNFTTTYHVQVVGDNFSFNATDQVKVTVDFGGLVITPEYINLDGPTNNQATATLTVNEFGGSADPITWSLDNVGDTGCSIDQNGVISGCTQSGTITVKATNQEYPDCYAEKSLEINGGIRDVTAADNANEGRIAHHGQTLYLIGPATPGPAGTVTFTAVPNENSSFPPGQPEWSGPLMPPPGNEITWITPPLALGSYPETVGALDPKNVTVEVLGPNESSIAIMVNTMLAQKIIDKLRGNTQVQETDAFCSTPLSFSLPGALAASYKTSNAVKYQDPGYGTKKEVSVDIPGIGVTGCVYFPCCTGGVQFGPVFVYYFTYFGSSLGLNLNVAAAKDPSTSANPMWTMSNLSVSVTGKLEAGIRLESEFSENAGIIAGANISTEGKLECRFSPSPDRLEWNASWGGLVGRISAAVWYGTMDSAIEVGFQRNLLNGAETGFQPLYQFPD
jgi:hypothetical protein